MNCPFPGMDPYVERSAIWPDFHDRFISALCADLQPKLRPRYAALTQNRLYVIESSRPIYPEVSIVRKGSTSPAASQVTATLEVDAPAVFEMWEETVREPYVEIIEQAAGNRVITTLEVISPENKAAGPGRESYRRKGDEYWRGGTNLIEIDLLHTGVTPVRVPVERLESLRPYDYLVAVSRQSPPLQEIYHFPLTQRLPRMRVPLQASDSDVVLDLQAVFNKVWSEGPYPELLHYHADLSPDWTSADRDWARGQVAAFGSP